MRAARDGESVCGPHGVDPQIEWFDAIYTDSYSVNGGGPSANGLIGLRLPCSAEGEAALAAAAFEEP